MKDLKLIICSYAVSPAINSSEGIVNRNWLNILKTKYECYLLSSNYSIKKTGSHSVISYKSRFLSLLYYLVKTDNFPIRVLYKIIANIFFKLTNTSLYTFLWHEWQQKNLQNIIGTKDILVWVRALPVLSLKPVMDVYQNTPFPIILNINDPIDFETRNIKGYDEVFRKLISGIQCFTFPSYALAVRTIKDYDLDPENCFVIPHAMKKQIILYNGPKSKNEKISFIYTGTFYKSAFSENLKSALIRFCESKESNRVEFIFILSQYDEHSIEWLRKSICNLKILTHLDRNEVLVHLANADCVLVIESEGHTELLKGKLAEAISFGLPILGITFQNSVMNMILSEYGGFCAYQNDADNIYNTLIKICENLIQDEWNNNFFKVRKCVINKFSEEKILEYSNKIIEYAYNKFHNENTLEKPNIPKWP